MVALTLQMYCVPSPELLHILGGEGGHGNPSEDLWNLLPRPQDAEGLGEVPRGGQEPRSPQAGPGIDSSTVSSTFNQ